MTFRTAASVLGGLTLTATALAQDVFIDTPTYKRFYLSGVPNFDQQRVAATVTIGGGSYQLLGLPGNGADYCCPTSATEWMDFLANRDWPDLAPGPGAITGSYTSGLQGLGEYDTVTEAIAVMGDFMDTNATSGTGGGTAQAGSLSFLNEVYPGYFNTVNVERDGFGFPSILDMLNSSLAGNLCEIYGGWYNTVSWNNTTAYYRNGGHCVALTSAAWENNPSLGIAIANPWTTDSKEVQSTEHYSGLTTTNASEWFVNLNSSGKVISGSQQYENVDFLNKKAGWILDGALEIQPYLGYTIKNGILYYLDPIRLVNKPSNVGVLPAFQIFTSPDGTPIEGATRNPITGRLFFFTKKSGVVYVADPVSGQIITLETDFTPAQIIFGATLQPFVLTKNGTFALWNFKAGTLSNGIKLTNVSGIVYDHVNDSVYWYYWGQNGVGAQFGQLAIPTGQTHFAQTTTYSLPVLPDGQGTIHVQIAGNELLLHQQGDANLYEVPLAGDEGYVARYLPAVQDAIAFAVDDMDRLYFSLNGSLEVTDLDGNTLASPFYGLPSGDTMQMAHSVSNYKSWLHGTPAWNNTVPADAFSGSAWK